MIVIAWLKLWMALKNASATATGWHILISGQILKRKAISFSRDLSRSLRVAVVCVICVVCVVCVMPASRLNCGKSHMLQAAPCGATRSAQLPGPSSARLIPPSLLGFTCSLVSGCASVSFSLYVSHSRALLKSSRSCCSSFLFTLLQDLSPF